MLWQGACSFTAGMTSGLLCAPSFPFGRPFNVDLHPCCLSIGEDRTRFRRTHRSCQVFPGHGGPLLSPCFVLSSDAQSFLAWQTSQKTDDSALAAPGSSLLQQRETQLPKPLCRAPQSEDSDGDLGPAAEHTSNDQDSPAGIPAWKGDESAEMPAVTATAAPSKATPTCADVRFLLSSFWDCSPFNFSLGFSHAVLSLQIGGL